MKLEDCSALITGASAGIGREFARKLAGRARSIVLVARRRDRLEQLRDEGAFASSDPDRNDAMLVVNALALTTLTRKLLPQMIARKRGAILNVSSSAGFLPIPGTAVYAATKAYVNSFSEALRAELRGCGVIVTALCPGPVHTEFQEVASRPDRKVKPGPGPDFLHVSVEQVVRDALAGVEADRPLVIPGFLMKVGMFLVRMTPMSILRRFSSKQR